jgi:hypothetical protein
MKHNPKNIVRSIGFPADSAEGKTTIHLNLLLGAFDVLARSLQSSHQYFEPSDTPKVSPMDGGAKLSVEATINDVCDRISAIVKDEARWAPPDGKHEAALRKLETEKLEVEKRAYERALKPHALYKPTLGRLADGTCMAYYGNPDEPSLFIYGVGDTLDEAVADFDRQFTLRATKINTLTPEPKSEQTKGNRKRKKGNTSND